MKTIITGCQYSVFLKITSAVAIDGAIARAGSIVEVTDDEAKQLLRRGKAELATEQDAPADGVEKEAIPEGSELATETAPKKKGKQADAE